MVGAGSHPRLDICYRELRVLLPRFLSPLASSFSSALVAFLSLLGRLFLVFSFHHSLPSRANALFDVGASFDVVCLVFPHQTKLLKCSYETHV